MKKFKQAPLPFIGQKRMFLNQFETALNEIIQDDGKGWTIIDVFGGSGLLSHHAKYIKPKANVIYNDYDNYSERLKHIGEINALRQIIADLMENHSKKEKRLSPQLKADILQAIQDFDGYKDLNCITSWVLFSGTTVKSFDDLHKHNFYNCIRQSPYPEADGYLAGVETVRQSFEQLIKDYQGKERVLLICDPPYICTDQKLYNNERYFDLIDFMQLIHLMKPPFIFFSSTKSEFIRFIDYLIETKADNWQTFENYKRLTVNAFLNYDRAYEDNLVFKTQNQE